MDSHLRLGRRLALALVLLGVAACSDRRGGDEPTAAERGPIVLVTLSGWRADSLARLGGEGSATPRLHAFAAAADWVGVGIAASADPLASLATLQTGVGPWKHRLLGTHAGRLQPQLATLAETLAQAGFAPEAHVPGSLRRARFGLLDGFAKSGGAQRRSAGSAGFGLPADVPAAAGSTFTWIHFPGPAAASRGERPGRRGSRDAGATAAAAGTSAPEVMSPGRYAQRLRAADESVGAWLEALRGSPAWDRTAVVLTSSHGTELVAKGELVGKGELVTKGERIENGELLGESAPVEAGALAADPAADPRLHRAVLEVPLVVKLPAGGPSVAEPQGARVALARVWATVVEAAGLRLAPVHAPSLFRASGAPILVEHYPRADANRFGLLAGDVLLRWTTPRGETPAEVRTPRRRRRRAERPREARPELAAFLATPPLSGGAEPPRLELERWVPAGVEPFEDPELAARLATELRRRWSRFQLDERTPRQELAAVKRGAKKTGDGA